MMVKLSVSKREQRAMKKRRTQSEPVLCTSSTSDCDSLCERVCNGTDTDIYHRAADNVSITSEMSDDPTQYVALDCEFVGVGTKQSSALGRCSIVDYYGHIVCDIYARPDEPITDYRTRWSGIRRQDMIRAIPVENARNIIKSILRDKVVVGHALHNDLSVLRMEQFVPGDMRRDTSQSLCLRQLAGLAHRPIASLKALTLAVLGRRIQTREHDSVEDARASMDLFRHVQSEWKTEAECDEKLLNAESVSVKRTSCELSDSEVDQCTRKHHGVKRQRLDSDTLPFLSDNYWPDDIHVCWF